MRDSVFENCSDFSQNVEMGVLVMIWGCMMMLCIWLWRCNGSCVCLNSCAWFLRESESDAFFPSIECRCWTFCNDLGMHDSCVLFHVCFGSGIDRMGSCVAVWSPAGEIHCASLSFNHPALMLSWHSPSLSLFVLITSVRVYKNEKSHSYRSPWESNVANEFSINYLSVFLPKYLIEILMQNIILMCIRKAILCQISWSRAHLDHCYVGIWMLWFSIPTGTLLAAV